MRDKSFFIFGGIYEKWIRPPKIGEFIFDDDPENPPASEIIESFSIITTPANPMVAAVHERMPLILAENDWLRWIDNRPIEIN